jgi:hypothetical protein
MAGIEGKPEAAGLEAMEFVCENGHSFVADAPTRLKGGLPPNEEEEILSGFSCPECGSPQVRLAGS